MKPSEPQHRRSTASLSAGISGPAETPLHPGQLSGGVQKRFNMVLQNAPALFH